MFSDANKTPPRELLECIVDWITADHCLCSESVRLVRIRSNFTCPLGGLVRWCILGPIVTIDVDESKSQEKGSSVVKKDTKQEQSLSSSSLMTIFSKLHLGVLLSLQAYRSMELNEQLFSYGDIYIVSKTLATYYKGGQCTEQVKDVVSVAVDRLAQTIQMALATRALSGYHFIMTY